MYSPDLLAFALECPPRAEVLNEDHKPLNTSAEPTSTTSPGHPLAAKALHNQASGLKDLKQVGDP